MNDETTLLTKAGVQPASNGNGGAVPSSESSIGNLSVRAVLALMLVATLCALYSLAFYNSKDVPPEFMTLVGSVLAFYFGKNQK